LKVSADFTDGSNGGDWPVGVNFAAWIRMKTIRGKKALITGAASGIGRAIALALAQHGADLYLVDIDDARLSAVAEDAAQFSRQVITAHCDLLRPDQISTTVRAVLEAWGGVDILVNNAGVIYHGHMDRMSPDQWNQLLGINLLAPIQLTRELLPSLLARPEAHVVNVCSLAGLAAFSKLAAYQTSKYALVGLTESLRAEYCWRGLGATAVCPAFVKTPMLEAEMERRGSRHRGRPSSWICATPEVVAAKSVQAIYRNQGLVLVTPLAYAMWYLKRFFPGLLDFVYCNRKQKHVQRRTAA
jgi:3-oxoacyl-[acyl-carrier protein] reductase